MKRTGADIRILQIYSQGEGPFSAFSPQAKLPVWRKSAKCMRCRFRIMTVVDDRTRERLSLIADTSLSGAQAAREPATLIDTRGNPRTAFVTSHADENTERPHSRRLHPATGPDAAQPPKAPRQRPLPNPPKQAKLKPRTALTLDKCRGQGHSF